MKVVLSKRLQALADMVSPGSRVADVGCDHGFLSIYLVQNGISPGCIAMDVRKGPLSRAAEHIARCKLEAYIETRLSDGLDAYRAGEAQTLVCAGMGGRLMGSILTRNEEKAKTFRELILQPQSELPLFRKTLRSLGYVILDENILWEDGKYYFLIKAAYGAAKTGEAAEGAFAETKTEQALLYDAFGEKLLKGRHPVLWEYLRRRLQMALELEKNLAPSQKDGAKDRLLQIREEISMLSEAMALFHEKKDGVQNDYCYDKGRRKTICEGDVV